MTKSKILIGLVVLLSTLFIVFQYNNNVVLSTMVRALIVPMISLLYFLNVKKRSIFFTIFLVLFSISEVTVLFSSYFPYQSEYFVGNSLYILAYIFLIYEILRDLDFAYLFKNFTIHLLVLSTLNIYVIYVLLKIEDPFVIGFEFVIEFVYNIVTLFLLSISLLNYFCKDNRKSLLLFLGSICIVFSEVIQIAYYYIAQKNLLNFSYSVLLILAFCFYYYQSTITESEDIKTIVN